MKKLILLIILLLIPLFQAYTCIGGIDANSHGCISYYPNLPVGNYPKILVPYCNTSGYPKTEIPYCSFVCNLGFYKSGNTCLPYVCQRGYDIPNEAVICEGDERSLTRDMVGTFVPSCTSYTKCEYVCPFGYSYSTDNRWGFPECTLNVCYEPTPPIDPNTIMCPDANLLLPNSMEKYLTNNCSTETRKCSWMCKLGYHRIFADNKLVCSPYVCTGTVPEHSAPYFFDVNELTQNTQITLVDFNTVAKCQYYCIEGFYRYGNSCIPSTCWGEIDSNAIIYPNDALGIIPKNELIKTLADSDTNRKCEYHCKLGFYRVDENCLPYLCNGSIDSNSVLCENDNLELDNFYTKSLVSSSSACSSLKKCEYYCREGFYEKDGVCLPFSTLTCEGNNFSDAILCPNDDVLLTEKGLTNILIDSNKNCSERKCEYYCKNGYYRGSGLDINKCIPFICDGNGFENSMLYYKDDSDLDKNMLKKLVDSNTDSKCEYYCKRGFHKGVGLDENKCIRNVYTCVGEFFNATLFENDEAELDANITSVLSKLNTSRKCEWVCNEGYVKLNNACVSTSKEEGVCGTANRTYLLDENFPGNYSLCEKGVSSVESPILSRVVGSSVLWNCVSATTANCKAIRREYSTESEFNSILELFTEVLADNNILISIKCSNDILVNLSISGSLAGEDYNLSENKIDCNNSLTTHQIKLLTPLVFDETQLVVKTSIKNTASNCYTCEKSSTLDVTSSSSNNQNSSFFIIGIIVVVLIIAVVLNVLFNQGEEDILE